MQELIRVTNNANGSQVVSARELHKFLNVQTEFKDWMPRMLEYGFENNVDFNLLKIEQVQIEGNREVKREVKDCALTLNMAKEIAMIQRTDRGKQARLYFIECEKQLQKPKELSRLEILTIAIESERKLLALEEKVLQDKPKLDFANQLLSSVNAIDFSTAAKGMNLPFGRTTLFSHCRNLNILRVNNEPYQEFINAKYFIVQETSYINPKTQQRVLTTKTMITAKGEAWLIKRLTHANIITT